MVSESQKKASAKWNKENMTTISCKVTKAKAERFSESCKMLGVVKNQVLLKAINETIEEAEKIKSRE